jgi:hypothetical protein
MRGAARSSPGPSARTPAGALTFTKVTDTRTVVGAWAGAGRAGASCRPAQALNSKIVISWPASRAMNLSRECESHRMNQMGACRKVFLWAGRVGLGRALSP